MYGNGIRCVYGFEKERIFLGYLYIMLWLEIEGEKGAGTSFSDRMLRRGI